MLSIELTERQRRALQAEQGNLIDVVDPATNRRYVLLAREQYDRMRSLLEPAAGRESAQADVAIPAGILRSQQAFWRDLPDLLRDQRNRRRWVCYHGDERIGIATSDEPLIRECIRRGIADDTYHLDVIEPHAIAPWEPEEIEGGGHEVDEEMDDLPNNTGSPL